MNNLPCSFAQMTRRVENTFTALFEQWDITANAFITASFFRFKWLCVSGRQIVREQLTGNGLDRFIIHILIILHGVSVLQYRICPMN